MARTLSVIISTHNPTPALLEKCFRSLEKQTLNSDLWELIVVDNASDQGKSPSLDVLAWHPNFQSVYEEKQGLTFARLAGITASCGDLLIFVDDDNILASDYLDCAQAYMAEHPNVSACGGKIEGQFELQPPEWISEFHKLLALRDFGEKEQEFSMQAGKLSFPEAAPIGAGMVLRRKAALRYQEKIQTDLSKGQAISDRSGSSLSSGGDNDIVLSILETGESVAYVPALRMQHLIPKTRLTVRYLANVNYASSKSWIQVLSKYGICPWNPVPAYSVLLRKMKAYVKFSAWKSKQAFIRWKGACGMFDALAELRSGEC